jgi:hypothetical protein
MWDLNEVDYFNRRTPGRTYISGMYQYKRPHSSDIGQPARNIFQVFECGDTGGEKDTSGWEWKNKAMATSKRKQIRISIAKEASHYKELVIECENSGKPDKLQRLLTLDGAQVEQFLDLLRAMGELSPTDELPHQIDSSLLRKLLNDPNTLQEAYRQQPENIRNLVEKDPEAKDVVALRARSDAVRYFEKLLFDYDFFESQQIKLGKKEKAKPEKVWQTFFEDNQWILGAGLGVPLFTAWDPEKLEIPVRGHSFRGEGKRVDGLYTTSGIIQSFVFAEIKTPDTPLLEKSSYRSGAWPVSKELAGGISQVHATVQAAEDEISGHMLQKETGDGMTIPDSEVFLFRPRAFLVIGSTKQFSDDNGGKNKGKIRSFELFRSSVLTPEIITYDELLAKAQWLVSANNKEGFSLETVEAVKAKEQTDE